MTAIEYLAYAALIGFGYCLAQVHGLVNIYLANRHGVLAERQRGVVVGEKIKSGEYPAPTDQALCETIAVDLMGAHPLVMPWFRMGAVYWNHYMITWLAKCIKGEFDTRAAAGHDIDREGWNNVLELNKLEMAHHSRTIGPRLETDR